MDLTPEKIKGMMEKAGAGKARCGMKGCRYEGYEYVWSERYMSFMCPSALTPEERKAAGVPDAP